MKVFFCISALIVTFLWILAIQMAPVESMDGKTVIYWSTDQNPARKDQLAPFVKMYPDIEVRIEPTTFQKTIVQWYSGIGPDIIEVYGQKDMVSYSKAGVLMDLTEAAKEMGFSYDSSYANIREKIEYNGRQYTYPANVSCQTLFYNKRIFRDAGLDYPTDGMPWEEFVELVKPLTVKRGDGRGYEQFAMVLSRQYAKDILFQFGGRFFNEQRTKCALDSSQAIAAMQFYKDLMDKHHVLPTPEAAAALSSEGGWGAGEIRWFATGRAASIWGSRWMMTQFRQYPKLHKELGVVLLPCPRGGQPLNYFAGRTPGINVNTKHKEAALKFMAYLASPEYNEVIAKGSDGMPPNSDYAKEATRLVNPDFPSEIFQNKFIDALKFAETPEVSPFVDPQYTDRLWIETLEIIENDLKPVDKAMLDLTEQLNKRIQRNVNNQKALNERYKELNAR